MGDARLLDTCEVIHAMDYGQFTISGGPDVDGLQLLAAAMQHPPSAGDGRSILVRSPHQNNFAMSVTVERWSGRPSRDDDEWEQISIERLTVREPGVVRLGSPTLEDTVCSVPPGEYRVEISGRGFVNDGWPGSTEPGDEWRLRFWPPTSHEDDVRRVWRRPD